MNHAESIDRIASAPADRASAPGDGVWRPNITARSLERVERDALKAGPTRRHQPPSRTGIVAKSIDKSNHWKLLRSAFPIGHDGGPQIGPHALGWRPAGHGPVRSR